MTRSTTTLRCPSCGGDKIETFDFNGRAMLRCTTARQKNNGMHGARRREWVAPCGFWSTRPDVFEAKNG